ncbi:MAG: hypothetical protein ACXVDF_07515 [Ktedonobacterales bacterium]
MRAFLWAFGSATWRPFSFGHLALLLVLAAMNDRSTARLLPVFWQILDW